MRRLVWLAVAGALFSLVGVLGEYSFFFDLVSHFKVQYVVGIAVALTVALVLRQLAAALLLLAVLCVHAYGVAGLYYPPATKRAASSADLRLMNCNVLASNTDDNAFVEIMSRVNPDVIVLVEYSRVWERALADKLDAYPHSIAEQLNNPFSIALFSKLPLTQKQLVHYGHGAIPSIDATIALDGRPLRVIATHPIPPVNPETFDNRNDQLQAIAAAAAAHKGAMVVAGDLNITPWSVHFKKMLDTGGLHNSRQGFGVLPSWPANFPPAGIPIDHILHNNPVSVLGVEISPDLGSDHLCIHADLRIDPQ